MIAADAITVVLITIMVSTTKLILATKALLVALSSSECVEGICGSRKFKKDLATEASNKISSKSNK